MPPANPLAVYRDPMTMDDYLAARPMSAPSDCWTATSRSTGRSRWSYRPPVTRRDCPGPPVAVEAIGGTPRRGGWFHRAGLSENGVG